MDAPTFDTLKFHDLLRRVAEHCQSPLGRGLLETTKPAFRFEEVQERLAPVAEALRLLDKGESVSLDGLGDPRAIWEAVGPAGHALEGDELLRVAAFLECVREAEAFVRQVRADTPALARLAEGLQPNPPLERDLHRALTPEGALADHASDTLARIRSDIRRNEQRLRDHVDRLVSQLSERGLLQDAFATVRGNRYVFPVRAQARNQVQGIVHGASNTGETVFIEPSPLVNLSNDLEELHQAELRESFRIRASLTDRVRPFLVHLRGDTDRLAALDGAFGRARAARHFGWSIPQVLEKTPLRLLDAHHPVLHLQNRESSIGVRLSVEPDDRVIVISGPNAGGKTTLLKTIGLAALLVQSGIPAPLSPDSRLPVFHEIWTDIGDAQDVAAGQSTFSAHARRLALILSRARAHSLVLLDELGTATDPSEGAALAEALLDILRKRGGLALATSHLTPLKQWAHQTPGVRNASFSLDPRTRTPTFHLVLDVPGTSEALVIAEREGIPGEVLDLARSKLQKGEVELGALLRTLGNRERALAEAEADVRRRLDALTDQEELARRRAEAAREERRRFRETAARQREHHLQSLREEIERRIAALPAREASLQEQRAALTRARREVQELQRDAEHERQLAEQSLPPALTPEELQPGRDVYVIDLRETGQILGVDRERRKAQIALGRGLVVEVPVDGLARSPGEAPSPAPLKGTDAPSAPIVDEDELGPDRGGPRRPKKRSRKIKRQETVASESTAEGAVESGFRPLDWRPGRRRRSPAPPPADADAEALPPSVSGARGIRFSRKSTIPWQIDLHGERAEPALERIDKYLDDAVLADLPYVKICHGHGTGRLATAIREFLGNHPHVRAWRYGLPEEGGAGVTVIELQ